jgi:hypothetical protein
LIGYIKGVVLQAHGRPTAHSDIDFEVLNIARSASSYKLATHFAYWQGFPCTGTKASLEQLVGTVDTAEDIDVPLDLAYGESKNTARVARTQPSPEEKNLSPMCPLETLKTGAGFQLWTTGLSH